MVTKRNESLASFSLHDPSRPRCGPERRVTCPRLRETGCQYCGLKGDLAHDQFFCERRHAGLRMFIIAPSRRDETENNVL